MKPVKKVQVLQIAGQNLAAEPGSSILVDTAKITKGQRKWDGELIIIRDLKGGKSKIVRIR